MFIEFGFGVVLALLLPKLRNLPVIWTAPLLATTAAFYLFDGTVGEFGADDWLQTLWDTNAAARILLFGVPAACFVTAALILERSFAGPVAGALARLGDASYSIYLVHALVLLGLLQAWHATGVHPAPWLVLTSGWVIAIGGGVVANIAIERPLQKRLRRLGSTSLLWSRSVRSATG
jgi:peptidoglycan/LPS O-acetylase OafA/YrhL